MKILNPRPTLYNPRIHLFYWIEPRSFNLFLQILLCSFLHFLERNHIFIEFKAEKSPPFFRPGSHRFRNDGKIGRNPAGDEILRGMREGSEAVEEEAGVVKTGFEGEYIVEKEDSIAIRFEETLAAIRDK